MTSAAPDSKFALEILKLLLQVAWADHEVAAEEAAALRDFAKRFGIEGPDLELIEAALTGQSRLPVPNLGLLRERRIEVLRAVRHMLESDSRIHEEETALLEELTDALR